MEEETQPKSRWEGKVSAKVRGAKADQVWPLIEDFTGLDKWLPGVKTSKLEGVYGQPGLIRYCEGTPSSDGTIKWSKERLIEIDPIKRSLSYDIVDSNMGFKSYVATMKVTPINGDDDESYTCQIESSYIADPNELWSLDDFTSFRETAIIAIAERMEKALQPN